LLPKRRSPSARAIAKAAASWSGSRATLSPRPPPPAAAALSGAQMTRAERREAEMAGGARAITSPMVGTFHRAAAPDQPAFAEVGDVVERGQVLCVIEAMKMMNEIEAEFRGRIIKIVVENGHPVEYGEALFLIEPV
jgi:acetyl-CoA carboxylase biotin carboxyl carrier protein